MNTKFNKLLKRFNNRKDSVLCTNDTQTYFKLNTVSVITDKIDNLPNTINSKEFNKGKVVELDNVSETILLNNCNNVGELPHPKYLKFSSKDVVRHNLTGVSYSIENNSHCSANGIMLITSDIYHRSDFIIPNDFLRIVYALHTKKELQNKLTFYYSNDNKSIMYEYDNIKVIANTNSNFPIIDRLIPRNNEYKLSINLSEPVSTMRKKYKNKHDIVKIDKTQVCIYDSFKRFSTNEVINEFTVYLNDFSSVKFNLSYLLDVLSCINGNHYTFESNNSTEAFVLKDGRETILLMPCK